MPNTLIIQKAVEILRKGGLVAFPTETVYGLGADASNESAIARVFAAKERPHTHPLIVHLHDAKDIATWARDIPDSAFLLAKEVWPGPLTLILKKQPHVLAAITAGQETVALRVPAHPIAQALLQVFGGGLVAPSANKFTHISPTTAKAVQDELGDQVDVILDGGACEVGLESTILDLSGDEPSILRPGMISLADLQTILGQPIHYASPKSEVKAPGMHHVHYAPHTPTSLFTLPALQTELSRHTTKQIAVLAINAFSVPAHVTLYRLPTDPIHYAKALYRTLRLIDDTHVDAIFIEAVPHSAEWDAINDRLLKSSGKRT